MRLPKRSGNQKLPAYSGWILFITLWFGINVLAFIFLSSVLDRNHNFLNYQRIAIRIRDQLKGVEFHLPGYYEGRRNSISAALGYYSVFRKSTRQLTNLHAEILPEAPRELRNAVRDNIFKAIAISREKESVRQLSASDVQTLLRARKEIDHVVDLLEGYFDFGPGAHVRARTLALGLVILGLDAFAILFLFFPALRNHQHLMERMSQAQVQLSEQSERFRRMTSATLSILNDLESSGQRLNEEMRRVDEKNQELSKLNQELETYTYITSHDLRGPLRHIASYTELLYELYPINGSDETGDLMNRIRKSVARMKNLLDGLTEFQKLSVSSRMVEKVCINDAIHRFREIFDEDIRINKAEIHCPALPLIAGSSVQVGQLFQNLLENALKYRSMHVPPRIWIDYSLSGERVYFSVSDNGRGVPPETVPGLFSIFRRYDPTNSVEGLGVGLAICKKIVEMHGGHLGVESIVGEGTTFRFDLPLWHDRRRDHAREVS